MQNNLKQGIDCGMQGFFDFDFDDSKIFWLDDNLYEIQVLVYNRQQRDEVGDWYFLILGMITH